MTSAPTSPVSIGILQNYTMILHNHSTRPRSRAPIMPARPCETHLDTLLGTWRWFATHSALCHNRLCAVRRRHGYCGETSVEMSRLGWSARCGEPTDGASKEKHHAEAHTNV